MNRLMSGAVTGAVSLLVFASSASAATFPVTSTDDDVDPGSPCGMIVGGGCTLREAILVANGSPGSDSIEFAIPGPGPHTITVAPALPALTGQTSVDGTSQPGFNGSVPLIELQGSSGPAAGLQVAAGGDDTTIQGLAITNFINGLYLDNGADGLTISGNYIGQDPSGVAQPNVNGVFLGVGTGHIFIGNHIVGAGDSTGIHSFASSTGFAQNQIQGWTHGIRVASGSGLVIGDTADAPPDLGNEFFDNERAITVETGEVAILRNSIHASSVLGIDLAAAGTADGVTPNDGVLDPDIGANTLQNFPVLDVATVSDTSATITGTLPAAGGSAVLLAYASDECGPSGYGDGERYLGSAVISPDPGGENAPFEIDTPGDVEPGDVITATADGGAGTSEFSECFEAIGPPSIANEEVVAGPVSGTVLVKVPGGGFVELTEQGLIPEGSIIDVTNGEVRIVSEAPGEPGETREAIFSEGQFKLTQEDEAPFLTVSTLTGGEPCPGKPKVKQRKLNFRGKGGHKNNGKHGSGTVRGTEFLTQDLCSEATKFSVREGSVKVRDFAKKKNVVVDAGDSYVAKKKKKKN